MCVLKLAFLGGIPVGLIYQVLPIGGHAVPQNSQTGGGSAASIPVFRFRVTATTGRVTPVRNPGRSSLRLGPV